MRSNPLATALVALLCCAARPAWAVEGPFVPADDAQVVETLRTRPLDRGEQEWRDWRAQLRATPDALPVALRVAQRAIEIGRRDGDPRDLGIAQAALAPWWSLAAPPVEVRLLKAVVLQSTHAFGPALDELDAVLRAAPGNAQAWLTQASILQVQGRTTEAARSCQRVRALGATLYADACLAELAGLTGRADMAAALLTRLARDASAAAPAWLQLMRAELDERRGDAAAAEVLFKAALAPGPDAYTLGAYADFLLDQGRPAEVVPLLRDAQRVDALLLRLALAYQALRRPETDAAVAALQMRFDAARLRGDIVHRREEARFLLQLRQRPEAALQVALQNWAVQKEPADARLVLAAARAAHDDPAAEPVRSALRASGLVDRRLQGLL